MMLRLEGLRAGYGRVPILAGIDLAVSAGELLGILGHNGMGKTTLLRTVMGYLPATAGRVRFREADITALKPHARARRGIGYVPQGRGIFPALSVRDNLRMGCMLAGDRRGAGIAGILERFPRLERLLERPGGALSGGEQQLLALARCLCGKPELLLLDEPTEGIQPSIVEEMAETLAELRDKTGLTIVLVEQNLEFIGALASRVSILEKGRIVGDVPPGATGDARIFEEFVGL